MVSPELTSVPGTHSELGMVSPGTHSVPGTHSEISIVSPELIKARQA